LPLLPVKIGDGTVTHLFKYIPYASEIVLKNYPVPAPYEMGLHSPYSEKKTVDTSLINLRFHAGSNPTLRFEAGKLLTRVIGIDIFYL
jgi:hypothetical protein